MADLDAVLDAGISAATADAGDAGVVEDEVVDTPEGDADGSEASEGTDESVEETAEGEDTEGTDEAEAHVETDGRKIEANVKNALSEIKKTNPQAAKTLQANYFENKAFKQEFPTVQEARNAKLALENLGGEEGIEALNSEVADYRNEIQQFANGDPNLLKQLQEANPESFVNMTGNALDLLKQTNKQAYEQARTPVVADYMESERINDAIVQLANYIKEGKGQEAYDLTRWVAQKLGALKTANDERAKAPKVDPRQQELDTQRQEIAQEKEKMYQESVGRVFGPMNEQVVNKLISPVIKQMKLKGDGLRDFKNGFYQKVFAAIKADKTLQRQAQALMAKGDADKAGRFLASKFAELAPSVFTKYRNSLYPNLAKASTAKAQTTGTGQKAAPKAVPGKVYTREQVDLRNTPAEYIITGQAYLKGTKTLVKYAQ
jgi:hypothetical protein